MAMLPLAERPGFGGMKENSIFQLEFMTFFEHDNAYFICISPAASLSDYVFSLIGSCTNDQNVSQSLGSHITGCIMADS